MGEISRHRLSREAFAVASDLRRRFDASHTWEGSAVELLVAFFANVRGWRGLYSWPQVGDESHSVAQGLYDAVRRRLREHPGEVELVPAGPTAADGA